MAERAGPLVLIGPPGAGKSSAAEHLARETGASRVDVDEVYWPYLRAHPDVAAAEPPGLVGAGGAIAVGSRRAYLTAVRARLTAVRGEVGAQRALEEAKAAAVARLVEETAEDAVVDFGAGHSIYEDLELRDRVRAALGRARVVLLLPCADVAVAVATLATRLAAQGRPMETARLRGYVTHPSNRALAGATLFTEGRTFAELCERLSPRPR